MKNESASIKDSRVEEDSLPKLPVISKQIFAIFLQSLESKKETPNNIIIGLKKALLQDKSFSENSIRIAISNTDQDI